MEKRRIGEHHNRSRIVIGLLAAITLTLSAGLAAFAGAPAATPAGAMLSQAGAQPTFTVQPGPAAPEAVGRDSAVRRDHPRVFAGSAVAGHIPELLDGIWRKFAADDLISTDAEGEGWIRLDGCMLIYVFQESGLTRSACSRDDLRAGNVVCSLAGTSAFNNRCGSQLIAQTANVELTLDEAWASVTYLPDENISLVMAFEGQPTAQLTPGSLSTGSQEPIPVESGFLVIDPDGNLALPDVKPGIVYELDQLLAHLIAELELFPWWQSLQQQAQVDDVPFPDLQYLQALSATCVPQRALVELRAGPGTDHAVVASIGRSTNLRPLAYWPNGQSWGKWVEVKERGALTTGWANVANVDCGIDLTTLPAPARRPVSPHAFRIPPAPRSTPAPPLAAAPQVGDQPAPPESTLVEDVCSITCFGMGEMMYECLDSCADHGYPLPPEESYEQQSQQAAD